MAIPQLYEELGEFLRLKAMSEEIPGALIGAVGTVIFTSVRHENLEKEDVLPIR